MAVSTLPSLVDHQRAGQEGQAGGRGGDRERPGVTGAMSPPADLATTIVTVTCEPIDEPRFCASVLTAITAPVYEASWITGGSMAGPRPAR
jgi:hypothetical protein